MKNLRRGRSKALFSEIDLLIFEKLIKEREVDKTKFDCGAYQHVIKRLRHWKSKGILELKDSGKSKVNIAKGKEEVVRFQTGFFSNN